MYVVYVSVYSFVRWVFVGLLEAKVRKNHSTTKIALIFEDIFQKSLAFRENVVILQTVGRGHGMKNQCIIKT